MKAARAVSFDAIMDDMSLSDVIIPSETTKAKVATSTSSSSSSFGGINESKKQSPNEVSCGSLSSLISTGELLKVGQSVCKINLPDGSVASGFLCLLPFKEVEIAGLMTNSHVISMEDLAAADEKSSRSNFVFQVCFEASTFKEKILVSRKHDVGRWFADDNLDATFLEFNALTLMKFAEKGIRALPISTYEPTEDLPVAVVQYPGGGEQKVAFSEITAIHDPDFKHTVTTDYGSSGSPVIDVATWTVIGIHKKRSDASELERYNWAVSMLAVVTGISAKFRLGLQSAMMRRKVPAATVPRAKSGRKSKYTLKANAKTLLDAAANGIIDLVREIVTSKPNLLEQARDKDNDDALNLASAHGHLEVVKFLVKKNKAIVKSRGFLGKTALIQAAEKGHLPVVKFLIEEGGADIYEKATGGNEGTALHLAACYGHVDIVAYLLSIEPNLLENAKNKNDDTALCEAAWNGHFLVVEYLVKQKAANVDVRGFKGRTPLLQAAEQGHLPIVKFLVEEAGSSLEVKDNSEFESTAIHLAAAFGNVDVVDYLLQKNPSLLEEAKDKENETALSRAAYKGHLNVVQFLVKQKKANVEIRGFKGRTPLLQASEKGHLAVVKFLIEEAGADIDARDSDHESQAIHLAAAFGNVDVVAYLLEKKPELIDAVNSFGQTPMHRAKMHNRSAVISLLVSKGAKDEQCLVM